MFTLTYVTCFIRQKGPTKQTNKNAEKTLMDAVLCTQTMYIEEQKCLATMSRFFVVSRNTCQVFRDKFCFKRKTCRVNETLKSYTTLIIKMAITTYTNQYTLIQLDNHIFYNDTKTNQQVIHQYKHGIK